MAGLPNSSNALQQWHHLFEAQGGPRTPEASQHLQQLLRLGLPTRKHEDWKYTPLDALLNGRFVADEGASLSAEQRDALALPLDAWRLVFIDGRYHPQLCDDLAASGVEVSVDNQRQHLPDALQPEVFLHLTESLAQTVTRIRVPRNRRLDKPLLLMHITSGLAGDALNTAHYRHHLALESGAEATIVEHYLSFDEQPHFTGGRLTMTVADNARLQCEVQQHKEEKRQKAQAAIHTGNVAFAEGLVAAGRLLPKHSAALIAVLDFAEGTDKPLEFGEGDDRQPVATGLKAIFNDLPKQISFAEQASKERQTSGARTGAELEFAEVETDPGRLDLHVRASQLAADKGIPYESAVRQLINH